MADDTINELVSRYARISDLASAAALLEWDQETYMPPGASEARANQIATLRTIAHELATSDELGTLLDKANGSAESDPLSFEASLTRVGRRDFEKATKLSPKLVAELARAESRAKDAWREARATDDFSSFAPHLSTLVELTKEKAEALGYDDQPYDALLDQFEPEMPTRTVASVFKDLRKRLVPIVEQILDEPAHSGEVVHRSFDPQAQWNLGMAVVRDFGYDLRCGRQDRSAHPFSTSFSISDVRITTRIDERFFSPAFYGTLHEAGHALYEQGIDPSYERTPLADGTSLGMHESQSRFWENVVGRSRAFVNHYYPTIRQTFPQTLADVTAEKFYESVNVVSPSLIRVEADEVTYNLHVMLRFELELAIFSGELAVSDLPTAWNDKMKEYLGLTPPSNSEGVLQDIHWSMGAFGYFPTYALGNLMCSQLVDKMNVDLGDIYEFVGRGKFEPILNWLREHVHRHGRAKTATQILEDVTGGGLSAESWLRYVRGKFGELYGIAIA